ncbi:MAG TPA: hypothetical protein VM008_10490 [Phycisphaerae bacterium]|nr:hypothetical protein [Phycisphaerae bacterium]
MADVDPNLVRAIAEQVMAALRGAAGGMGSPTEIHSPIGQCTGDYSKFPELKGIQTAPGPGTEKGNMMGMPNGAPAPQGMAPGGAPVAVLTGVVTVSQLKGVRGTVRLAKGAILSPLAADFVKEQRLNVVSDGQAVATAVNVGAGIATGAPIFWWIGGQCASVAKVVETLRPNVMASRERSSGESLRGVVKELAGLVKSKKVCCGLLFVDSAARAACYANRCHSLRAIVGTNDKAVSDGVEQLGANVLIIEYPQLGYKGMMGLIKPFLESQHAAPAAVLKELNELAACG